MYGTEIIPYVCQYSFQRIRSHFHITYGDHLQSFLLPLKGLLWVELPALTAMASLVDPHTATT